MNDRMTENSKKVQGKRGLNRSSLWFIGILLILFGMLSRGILQNRFLQVSAASMEELLQTLDLEGGMTAAATALVLEALETCAVPVFAVLTVDGFVRTSSFRNYFLRLLGLAIISELPYHYALNEDLLTSSSRNPVFGLVLSLVMLYFFRQYQGLSLGRILLKAVVFAAALFWGLSLQVKFGVIMLLLAAILWAFRNRPSLRLWIASAAAVCCCVGNPLYMFMPFGFLLAWLYNEEPGRQNRILQYLMYPILLLLIGLAGTLLV